MGLVCGVDAVGDRLEVALHDRQRRPQLVAHVGQQRATLALIGLEPFDHRVEPVDQRSGRGPRLGTSTRTP